MKSSVLRTLRAAFSAVCLYALIAELTFPQTQPEVNKTIPQTDPQLHLSVNKAEFRCGEVIPLDLAFTSSTHDRYEINMASYDRSGRMSHEQFLLDPKEGSSDPLQLYFNSSWGFLGGGLTAFKLLSTSPISIHLDLNEWVRFDRPGVYRLTVISHRISDTRDADYPQHAGMEVKSNSIELQIIAADPTWQQSELKQILQALNRPGPSGGDLRNDPRQAARMTLRYLGSEEAARELARRLRGEDTRADGGYMLGLIGSPHRDIGLQEINKLFDAPDFPISDLFLTTMSILPLNLGRKPTPTIPR